jgi:transposase
MEIYLFIVNTSTVIGLTSSGRIYKRHVVHAICGDDIVITLRHVQRHVPGPLVIIWERLNAYRTKVVKAYVEAHPDIELHWLPPYAPDLNPEEGCHGHGKQHLHNALPTNVANLRRDRTDGLKE